MVQSEVTESECGLLSLAHTAYDNQKRILVKKRFSEELQLNIETH